MPDSPSATGVLRLKDCSRPRAEHKRHRSQGLGQRDFLTMCNPGTSAARLRWQNGILEKGRSESHNTQGQLENHSIPSAMAPTIRINLTSLGQSLQSLNIQEKIHTPFSEFCSTGKGRPGILAVPSDEFRALLCRIRSHSQEEEASARAQTLVQASFLWRQGQSN